MSDKRPILVGDMLIELDVFEKFALDVHIFRKIWNLYAYLGTFSTCTRIHFGKFVILYGYSRLYGY